MTTTNTLSQHTLQHMETKRDAWRTVTWVMTGCLIIVLIAVLHFANELDAYDKSTEPTIIVIREQVRKMTVKAYCACSICCEPYADGITASGHLAEGNFVAAPKDIPFGTLIRIPSYADGAYVPVLDRGPGPDSNRIEVFFTSHQDALNFGVRQEWVTIQEVSTWEI